MPAFLKSAALIAGGIVVPDWPNTINPAMLRHYEPFIAMGLGDREAWESALGDEERLYIFRCVHGNRKSKPKRRSRKPKGP